MPRRFRPRFAVALSALALVAATIVPAGSAVAEEPPASDPIVTSEPTPEATPTEEPTPDTTPSPESTPTPEPAPEPEPSPAPEPDAVPAQMVEYSGTVNQIADEGHGDGTPAMALLNVPGQGFLPVDTSGLGAATDLSGPLSLTVAVPEDLTLSASESQFEQLATYGATVAPLVAVDAEPSKLTAPRDFASAINQTPSTAATHQVYAVLVSPNGMASSPNNPTPAEAATLVGYANDYWSNQSSDNIQFSLVNTVPWYPSTYSCVDNTGAVALWNEAAAKATSSFGYAAGKNVHLMLLFPSNANCGGRIGLGSIGGSVNDGGVLWVLGGNNPSIRKATTAHELGHNLSLGHADWLECAAPNPHVGQAEVNPETQFTPSSIDNCEVNYYGDMADVMGYGHDNVDGGSLSSPNAIRAGIWPAGSWFNAPQGESTTEINSVSSNSGVRAVVAQDSDGTNYFVEYRDFTGDDSEMAVFGCDPEPGTSGGGACVSETPNEVGVRILRMEPSGLQGVPGYDSFLIGRNTDQVKFQPTQTYTTSTGMTIQVTASDPELGTATIKVTRPVTNVITGIVWIGPTIYGDKPKQLLPSGKQVADTISAFVGETWVADSFTYQWRRNGSPISGETARDYVLKPDDVGQMISVTVTGAIPTKPSLSVTSSGYGPITLGTIFGAGTVGIAGTLKLGEVLTASSTFAAHDLNGPVTTVTSYQWLRNGVVIPSETNATYTMQPTDYLQTITARAILTATGYTSITSAASNAKIPNIKGTIQGTHDLPTMAKTISVPTFKLTATLPAGSVTEPGVTLAYQWYRVNRVTSALTAITGATSVDYTPVAADYAYELKVRVIVTKSNYNSVTLYALAKDYSLRLDPATPLGFGGAPVKVDSTIEPNTLSFIAEEDDGSISTYAVAALTSHKVNWYRSGVMIAEPGGAVWQFPLTSLDLGKIMSYRLNANLDGWLPIVQAISPNSSTVAVASFSGVAPAVDGSGLTKTVHAALSDVSPPATSMTYRWYRDGIAISGATLPSYTLVAADYGKTVTVKVSYLKSGYATYVLTGDSGGTGKYWLRADSIAPVISFGLSEPRVDGTLYVDPRTYYDMTTGAAIPGVEAYQWLRDGVAIGGAADSTYHLEFADKGHKISVKVTASAPGLLPSIATSAATPAIGTNVIQDWNDTEHPSLDVSGTTYSTVLAVPLPGAYGITETGIAVAYQWYRTNPNTGVTSAVPYATSRTYTLGSSDRGYELWARVTISKAPSGGTTYTTVIKTTEHVNRSLVAGSGAQIQVLTTFAVGSEITPTVPAFSNPDDGVVTGFSQKFQWYRTISGITTAISGATSSNYFLKSADLGATIKVVVTTGKAGYIAHTATYTTSPSTMKVLKGTLLGTSGIPTVSVGNPATNTLLATPPAVTGSVGTGSPTAKFSYLWFRDGSPIRYSSGLYATAQTYKLQSADWGKDINVRVIASLSGYTSVTLPLSTPIDYSITSNNAPPTITGTKAAGQQLTAVPPPYFEADGSTPIGTPPTLTYTWYRNGYVVAGATSATYTLQGTDVGSIFKVRVIASLPGRVSHVSPASVATPTIVKGNMNPGSFHPVVTMINTSLRTMKVSFTGTPLIPTGGLAATYKWYREGVATPISTVSSYNLVAADTGKAVTVVVTLSKTGFHNYVYSAVLANGISHSQPAVIVGDDEIDAILACQAPTYSLASGAPVSGINGTITYQWYRESTLISGETGVNYTVADADQNSSLYCEVTVTAPYHDTLVEKTAAHVIPS